MNHLLNITRLTITLVILCLIAVLCSGYDNQHVTSPEGQYLGQTPPGTTPVLFAPGIISNLEEEGLPRKCLFSEDGTACYVEWFSVIAGNRKSNLYVSHYINHTWSAFTPVTDLNQYGPAESTLSPGESRMFFTPYIVESVPNYKEPSLYCSDLTDTGWTEAQYISRGLHGAVTYDGTVYWGGFTYQGDAITYREREGDGYSLQKVLEYPTWDSHDACWPAVAPDGSYVIFGSFSRPHNNKCYLFVVFNNGDGTWTAPQNLEIGDCQDWTEMPYISPDGLYLFFCSEGGINWVSTSIIDNYRPE